MFRKIVLALIVALPLSACATGTSPRSTPSPTASTSTRAGSTPAPTASASRSTATPSPSRSPTPTGTSAAGFGYLPLWPFGSVAEAEAWQRAALPGGHQPWHLNADETTLSFTRYYLGFTEIDRVVGRSVGDTEAHIAVGYLTGGGGVGTAAVIHLARIGTGALTTRPWEVVGTDDKPTFTITAPAYGARVSSPVTVGGRISGVDESIRVTIRRGAALVGSYCCLPAGGGASGQAWSTSVRFTARSGDVLAILASTGGHLQAVERFAVTGARVA